MIAQLSQCTGARVGRNLLPIPYATQRVAYLSLSPRLFRATAALARRALARRVVTSFGDSMERHVVVAATEGPDVGFFVEQRPLETTERDDAPDFLKSRFPLHCPHHILHNLLNGHYGRHQLCDARPFRDEQCRHGSHSRPQLSAAEMSYTAPAAGVVIFLPFGLSYGTSCGGASRLVSGCADCEFLDDGDACGSCHRVWHRGSAMPVQGFYGTEGQYASLAKWRESVCLSGSGLPGGGEMDKEEGWEEEDWGDEEWGEEGWDEEEEDGEEGDGEPQWADEAEEAAEDGEDDAPSWGEGRWTSDGSGNWSWTVDFLAPLPAPKTGADAPVPAELRRETLAAPAATEATVAADATVRILELELELARLRRAQPA